MITPWEIYWVLQLDSINGALGVVGGACGVAAILIGIVAVISSDLGDVSDESWAVIKRWLKCLVVVAGVCIVLLGVIPSTKTAAAMIVVPAIVNNKAVQHEAGDLYALAKEALKEAIAPKEAK